MTRWISEIARREGGHIFVVGTGTSLAGFDLSRLRGHRTIALNDAIKYMSPTYHLYTDNIGHRYPDHRGATIITGSRRSYEGALARFGEKTGVYLFETTKTPTEAPRALYKFATVAVTAIHFAQRLGVERIYLLGVDAYRLKDARYFDGRKASNRKAYKVISPKHERELMEKHHLRWLRAADTIEEFLRSRSEPSPEVINLSEQSKIETWPKRNLESTIAAFETLSGRAKGGARSS